MEMKRRSTVEDALPYTQAVVEKVCPLGGRRCIDPVLAKSRRPKR